MIPNAAEFDGGPEYLRDLIESSGYTQKKIGEILGVDERTVRRWVHGERRYAYVVQFALECLVLNADPSGE